MRRLTLLAILLSACAVLAGPITGPAEIKRDTIGVFEIKAKGDLDLYNVPDGLSIEKTPGKWYVTGKPGEYRLRGDDFWADFEAKKIGRDKFDVRFKIVGDTAPTPPGPTPTPGPSVRTNPFSDDAPRVLLLWDHEGTPLTAEQTATLYGIDTRKTIREFAGSNFWVHTTKADPTDKVFSEAVKSGGKSYPWFKVGIGAKGLEGPVRGPAELAAILDELKPKTASVEPAAWTVGGATFTPTNCRTVFQNGRWVTICP